MFVATVSVFLRPNLKKTSVGVDLHQLLVEGDHVAVGVVLARVRPEASHVGMGYELEVGREPNAWYSRSVLMDA